jgi:hypothetical protein
VRQRCDSAADCTPESSSSLLPARTCSICIAIALLASSYCERWRESTRLLTRRGELTSTRLACASRAPHTPASSLHSTSPDLRVLETTPPHPPYLASPAAMSAAAANGDAASRGPSAVAKSQGQQPKNGASGKMLDAARKQAGSPVDGQNK